MRVHFYDVGQALAVLVELPDGRHVMVDAGDDPARPGCERCSAANGHLLARLRADLGGHPIDMLWVTHPHSDHVGGTSSVLDFFPVGMLVDDGRDEKKPEVRRARESARRHEVPVHVVDPTHPGSPLPSSPLVSLTAIVPPKWPGSCARDPNDCSIGLRIDYCSSSVLLLGDAEREEEAKLDPHGPVTLLQVAHHGSDTSSSDAFLARASPRYAVVSAGKPGEGANAEYCHPRIEAVERVSRRLGGEGEGVLKAFDGTVRCERAAPNNWVDVPVSNHLWATERDGDVTLITDGDGTFTRE